MLYVDFNAGNKEYKLRLNTRNIISLEKNIGCNPLAAFGNGETLPTVTVLVNILHSSLQQYHHGISLNDTYDIFDAYLEEHTITEFIKLIMEIYKVSGLIPEGVSEKN